MLKNIAASIVAVSNSLDSMGLLSLAKKLDSVLESISVRPNLLDVPDIRQFNNYSCGSACLMAILGYWDLYEGNEKLLGKILGTNYKDGTSPESIAMVARRFGLKSKIQRNCTLEQIQESIDRKEPIIANFQAWSESEHPDYRHSEIDGHYAVVIGMDSKNIYFRDPSIYNKVGFLSKSDFMKRWHDGKKPQHERVAIFFSGSRPAIKDEFEQIK